MKFFTLSFILVAAFILFLLFFPNYYASQNPPSGLVYAGQTAWFDPWDLNVYVAAINWSQENSFNFQNAYTTQAHQSVIIYPLYTFLGVLFPNTEPFIIFSAATLFFSIILMLILAKISSVFLKNRKEVLVVLILTSLGGGLGWILPESIVSPDTKVTPFTFVSAFQKPHEALAISFYFSALALFYLAIKKRKLVFNLISLFLITLVIPFYPYHLLSFFLITGYFSLSFALKNNKRYPIFYLLTIFSVTLPVGVFYSLYLTSSSSFEAVFAPNLGTANIIQVALGYGILFPLALLPLFIKKKNDKHTYLLFWFFLSLLASYLTLPFARYFLRGLFFPAVLLSIYSLELISKRFEVSKNLLLILLLIIVPLSSISIFFNRLDYIKQGNRWFFLSKEEKGALNFLNKKTKTGSGVLTSYRLGNFIPAYTKNRVYFGHYFQTPGVNQKIKRLNQFYKNELTENEARKFLAENNISYVVWGEDEEKITLSSNNRRLNYDFLKPVLSDSKIIVYSLTE